MTRNEAKDTVKRDWRRIMPQLTGPAKKDVNKETSWICPKCGHGKNGDGLTADPKSQSGQELKCFGCGFYGDIISLYREITGTDYNTALADLTKMDGITIDASATAESGSGKTDDQRLKAQVKRMPAQAENRVTKVETSEYDFAKTLEAAHNELLNTPEALKHYTDRRLTIDIINEYKLGYNKNGYNDIVKEYPELQKKGSYYYQYTFPAFDTDDGEQHYFITEISDRDKGHKYDKPANVAQVLFNERYLKRKDPPKVIFLCEGVYDALSIEAAGGKAIALYGQGNQRFRALCDQYHPDTAFVISLDNDKSGQEAALKMAEDLNELHMTYIQKRAPTGKDCNESLCTDRKKFERYVKQTQIDAKVKTYAQRAKAREAAKPVKPEIDLGTNYLQYMFDGDFRREASKHKDDIKTGYSNLDERVGGLYAGLYCVAALSSLGKTTFCSQMAEQIATAGHDVLYFTLEQSRLEMTCKGLARAVARKRHDTAIWSQDIRKGKYKEPEIADIINAHALEIGDRLTYIEGNFGYTGQQIVETVKCYIAAKGKKPVVFVDYLQLLQPEPEKRKSAITMDTIDDNVRELKKLSKEYGITVFAISSVNRTSYTMPIDMDSLKGSGGIEFTCDVIWGLQLQVVGEDSFIGSSKAGAGKAAQENSIAGKAKKIRDAKAEKPRKMELCSLKNRYGEATFDKDERLLFDYYSQVDYFVPTTKDGEPEESLFIGNYEKMGDLPPEEKETNNFDNLIIGNGTEYKSSNRSRAKH